MGTLDKFPITISATHHFVPNTFLLGFCHAYKKSAFRGFIYKAYNRKFHTKYVIINMK